MSAVAYPHIEFDADGVPMLSGSRTKVIEIALDYLAHHWDADEIRRQHPYLSLGQIHSALAYYFDHREDLDRQIDAQVETVAELREQAGPSPVTAKLQRLGRLP
jgi:uncharacterized protein (DUF433 family)